MKNSILTSKILNVYFGLHRHVYESEEETRNLRRIQKAEEINPLSCTNKRKQVCQLPVMKNLVYLQQFLLLLCLFVFQIENIFSRSPKPKVGLQIL